MTTTADAHVVAPTPTFLRHRDAKHAYSTLAGGKGRAVFYRLDRTLVTTLVESGEQADHEVHIGALKGTLLNYTPHGVAFNVPGSAVLAVGEQLDELEILIGGESVYRGAALVRHTRIECDRRLVGVALLDGILDPDRLLSAKARSAIRRKTFNVSGVRNAEIGQDYRRTLADAVFLMNSFRALLDAQERDLIGATTSSARLRSGHEILTAAEASFREQFASLRYALNEQSANLPKRLRVSYKSYTEALIHPAVLCAPAAHHCYEKPLGYPGDFVLMSYLYSDKRWGDSLYAKLIHQVVVREEPLAYAVRQRKEFILSQIRQTVCAGRDQPDPPRILSLGCGPAQEIQDLLSSNASMRATITLIDQDQRCLAHVDRALSTAGIPQQALSSIQYLHVGLKQLLLHKEFVDAIPLQDLIYTAGVFDYLGAHLAQRLTQWLYQRLRPGGQLVIGNVRQIDGVAWSLDYWMDWPLTYRTREEMFAIAGLLPDNCEREVALDASGYTYMLLIRKP